MKRALAVFDKDFYQVYTSDPAAEAGRMEAIVEVIGSDVEFVTPEPASEAQIAAAHTNAHVDYVLRYDPYSIAAMAAGGAIRAARIGLQEPAFGLIRPPGHHASSYSCWGFCYFNNIAIALQRIRTEPRGIRSSGWTYLVRCSSYKIAVRFYVTRLRRSKKGNSYTIKLI